ncbi:MAG: hypothetical protein L6R42_007541, partial [Xanthoria sp. 1 TBL-2021]
ILFLVQANLWFLFRFVRFFIGKIWAVVCFLWALCTLFFAFVGFIYRSIDAIFSPSSGNEARKARIITVNESLRD